MAAGGAAVLGLVAVIGLLAFGGKKKKAALAQFEGPVPDLPEVPDDGGGADGAPAPGEPPGVTAQYNDAIIDTTWVLSCAVNGPKGPPCSLEALDQAQGRLGNLLNQVGAQLSAEHRQALLDRIGATQGAMRRVTYALQSFGPTIEQTSDADDLRVLATFFARWGSAAQGYVAAATQKADALDASWVPDWFEE